MFMASRAARYRLPVRGSGSVAGEADRKLSTGAPRAIARPRSEGPTYSGFTPSPVHAIVGAWLCSPAAGILTPCKRPGWSITAMCASARSPCARAIQPIPTRGAGAVASIRDDLSPGNARTERRRASRPRAREVKSRIALPAPPRLYWSKLSRGIGRASGHAPDWLSLDDRFGISTIKKR